MKQAIYHRALDVTIRLALGSLAAGCGTPANDPSSKSEDVTSSYDASTDEGRTGDEPGDGASNGTPAYDASSDVSAPSDAGGASNDASANDCPALFAEFDAGPWWAPGGERNHDPALVQCCNEAAKKVGDSSNDEFLKQLEEFRSTGCCSVAVDNVGTLCAPWGPPVPPEMPAFLAMVA